MKNSILKLRFALNATLCIGIGHVAQAHMPWLATSDDGHAMVWFGESPSERTYAMPPAIESIVLSSDQSPHPVPTKSVTGDDFVGLRSQMPINLHQEISGTTTYGLYHGTKLTYYVEHLPQVDANQWPTEPRSDGTLQSVITPHLDGVMVKVICDGKPVADQEVKLFCEDGHEEASGTTGVDGTVAFGAGDVESGLNAIVVGMTDDNAVGNYQGEAFASTTDYLTATFHFGSRTGESAKKDVGPVVDSNSGASVETTALAELPEELTSFGAAVVDQKLYVYGGHTGKAHSYSNQEQSNRLWCLDLSSQSSQMTGAAGDQTPASEWEKVSTGPSLQGLAMVGYAGRLIRIGGFTAVNEMDAEHELRSQTSVAMFDPETKSWSDMPSLPEPRSSFDAAVLDDTVYVFGGWQLDGTNDDSTWHQTAWSLDLSDESASWQALAAPRFERRAVSVAAFEGKLFIVGGMQSEGGPTTKVSIYDPASDSWSDGPTLPGSGMSGFGSSSFATGGKLYVSTLDGFVHCLDHSQTQWRTIAKSKPARFFHRMLPVDQSHLLMIGGANMSIGKFTQIDVIRVAAKP